MPVLFDQGRSLIYFSIIVIFFEPLINASPAANVGICKVYGVGWFNVIVLSKFHGAFRLIVPLVCRNFRFSHDLFFNELFEKIKSIFDLSMNLGCNAQDLRRLLFRDRGVRINGIIPVRNRPSS